MFLNPHSTHDSDTANSNWSQRRLLTQLSLYNTNEPLQLKWAEVGSFAPLSSRSCLNCFPFMSPRKIRHNSTLWDSVFHVCLNYTGTPHCNPRQPCHLMCLTFDADSWRRCTACLSGRGACSVLSGWSQWCLILSVFNMIKKKEDVCY